LIVLAPDFMIKVCKKAAQHFHCAVSKVFDRMKSVALWFANIRKLTKDHKVYGSTARIEHAVKTYTKHINVLIALQLPSLILIKVGFTSRCF